MEDVSAALRAPGRLAALADTGLDAVADPGLDRFASMVARVLGVPVALVSLVTPARQFFPGLRGLGGHWGWARQTPLSHSFCQLVVAAGEPLVVTDARHDVRVCESAAIGDLNVVGYAGMPLTDTDGAVLGSLCAIDHEPRHWTADELSLLADLAAACSDLLRLRIAHRQAERADAAAGALTARVESARGRSRLLLRAGALLSRAESLPDIVAAMKELLDTVDGGPTAAHVSVYDAGPDRITGLTEAAVPLGDGPDGLVGRAVRTAQPVLVPDAGAELPHLRAELHRYGWSAVACVPLPGVRGPIGALTVAWPRPHRVGIGEQAVLATLAGYLAHAVQRATDRERQSAGAATLQKALLSPLPRVDHLRLVARYQPAHHTDHVGGDWYDAIALPDRRLALVIGDVSGHDLGAAAAMSQLRSMLRGYLVDRVEPPSGILRRLDQANRTLGAHTVATLIVAYLDPAPDGAHVLRWSNAGHPPPLVLGPDGAATVLPGRDPLLGVGDRIPRRNHEVLLPPGATVLLHTDGLTDSRDGGLDGAGRLRALLTAHRDLDADELADLVVRTPADPACADDIAILLVRTPR